MDANESASFEARAAALVVTASRKISPAAARHEPSPGKQMKLPITPFLRSTAMQKTFLARIPSQELA